jgi:hypothetical protein
MHRTRTLPGRTREPSRLHAHAHIRPLCDAVGQVVDPKKVAQVTKWTKVKDGAKGVSQSPAPQCMCTGCYCARTHAQAYKLFKASKKVESELYECNKMYEVHSDDGAEKRGTPNPIRQAPQK